MERHRQAVRLLSAAVRAFFERAEPYRIWHGSTNSTRPAHQKAGARLVDISGLRNVLSVDAARRIALVEPNVPMDRLVEHTLAHGLVPPVVMEFPGITAGGGFAGTAGESSSFKHGYFDENVRGVEIVLPDGEVVFAKPGDGVGKEGEYADLFRGATGALGTLGVATLLELRLIEAKRFVRTTYRRTSSVAEAVRVVREECEKDRGNDYVDGILFSKDHGVVVTGKLTNELPDNEKVQTFSRAWDPWYYMHVRERTANLPSSASITPKDGSVTEYIPLAEYLFRYDRGGFWVGQAAFDYFRPVPFNRFFRWFLDDFLHTRMLYRALHGSGESGRFVVQDVGMPYEAAEPFVDYVSEHLDIWPLWLCPLKTPAGPSFHPHLRSVLDLPGERIEGDNIGEFSSGSLGEEAGQMLNIGVWGWGPKDRDAFVRANRDLERRVDELGGMKWLYAHTYYSEPEFWRAYGGHRARYEALRERYRAESLPSVYDKVRVKVDPKSENDWKSRVKATWPFGGLVGIWKGIKSRDYMLHRRATWKWKGGDGGEGKEKIA
ncbi:FAD-binding domain-containing protein [Annulohypoxylon maeteangense]|uniref:FAD-binding domain-containing protein n=1 Tax=Annulohypoxylon maeteangense TaxID=1927788 RepID=UPI002007B117|nr:FAD-binding domain-containing protein [Annulohypoxylon maeteangense]KAI0887978.1 FAD-binding domain-containing protein [Annulohypoxylon maeteangense]